MAPTTLVRAARRAGATLDLRDKQKRTPLDLALGVGLKARTPDDDVPVRKSTAALLTDAMSKQGIPVAAR